VPVEKAILVYIPRSATMHSAVVEAVISLHQVEFNEIRSDNEQDKGRIRFPGIADLEEIRLDRVGGVVQRKLRSEKVAGRILGRQ
jgi:hypothetical protein